MSRAFGEAEDVFSWGNATSRLFAGARIETPLAGGSRRGGQGRPFGRPQGEALTAPGLVVASHHRRGPPSGGPGCR